MINLSTEARLNILLPNMNKALGEALKNATPEQLETLREGKDLQSFLTSLFKDKLTSAKSDTALSHILRNSPFFQTMGNVTETLGLLIQELKNSPEFIKKGEMFEDDFKTISVLDSKSLKNQIKESGIFMESKIAQVLQTIPNFEQSLDHPIIATLSKEAIEHDLKSKLLSLAQELKVSTDSYASKLLEQVDRLLLQIDYYQLTSSLENANVLYFPFSWDQLENGSLRFKKGDDKKFYCQIDLTLKTYGTLKLMMGLYEENQLEIRIDTEKEEFKSLIFEHLDQLHAAFINSELYLRSIRISYKDELKIPISYEKEFDQGNGFEVIV